ncbi:MAG: NERD domain-containing protein [Planctomycetota bacterium]
MSDKFWKTVTPSGFPWEREALDFIRESLPDREPYRAWSNFEFIADDGSVNEVDLLVLAPPGFFLIEIESKPGTLSGDAGTWTWRHEGKAAADDNPLLAANRKSKKLASLLRRQKAAKNWGRIPFLEPLVFLSARDLRCNLPDSARSRICLRDRPATDDRPERPGIIAALEERRCPGLDPTNRDTINRELAKVLTQALDQAGIRPSRRPRRVSDFELNELLSDGAGYQDWRATHVKLPGVERRIRIYLVRPAASADDRATIERAATRKFRILETLRHPSILRVENLSSHDLGPALIFEAPRASLRLDHFLTERNEHLTIDDRLHLVRQIAEAIRFAHEKKVVHRALSPQNILVAHPQGDRPQIRIFNWQTGYRDAATTSSDSSQITATAHVERLVKPPRGRVLAIDTELTSYCKPTIEPARLAAPRTREPRLCGSKTRRASDVW